MLNVNRRRQLKNISGFIAGAAASKLHLELDRGFLWY